MIRQFTVRWFLNRIKTLQSQRDYFKKLAVDMACYLANITDKAIDERLDFIDLNRISVEGYYEIQELIRKANDI